MLTYADASYYYYILLYMCPHTLAFNGLPQKRKGNKKIVLWGRAATAKSGAVESAAP
jgi:hypothetical protein